jgi:hypothetical protein
VWKKEDVKSQGLPENSPGNPAAVPVPVGSAPRETNAGLPASSKGSASISQGIRIKGEVTGSEDLFVDGQVDGKVNASPSKTALCFAAAWKSRPESPSISTRKRAAPLPALQRAVPSR